jgi:teichuronic acid biosynthesis protein TuaE
LLLVIFSLKTLFSGKIIIHQKSIKWYILFLFFWLGYSVISLAWAPSKGDAIRDIIFLFMSVLLIFFFTYYIKNETDLKKVYNIWLAVLGILIIIGFWEHLTGNHLSVSRNYNEIRSWRMFIPTGVFFNPNDYATFLALSIPFGIAIFRYCKRKCILLFSLLIVASSLYLLVTTGSRANIIGFVFEFIFIFLFLMNINKKTKFIIFLVCFLALFVLFPPGNYLQHFLNSIVEELISIGYQASLMEGSVGIRVNLVKNGLNFLYKTAGFGVGAGNAEYYMANYSQYYTAGILNPHNWWLEILVNYGVVVFFGYVLFYIGIIRNLWKIYQNNLLKVEKMICEALLVSLVGFFFASISSSSIMAFKPQWLLFAFALSFINYFYKKKEEDVIVK